MRSRRALGASWWRAVVLVTAVVFAMPTQAAGQDRESAGTISGRVVDASTMRPLEGMVLTR